MKRVEPKVRKEKSPLKVDTPPYVENSEMLGVSKQY
jgi:hypothetical protein